jgi:hypothetical protein
MTNDEIPMTNQCANDPMTKQVAAVAPVWGKFVIRTSPLIGHWCFDIRHFHQ